MANTTIIGYGDVKICMTCGGKGEGYTHCTHSHDCWGKPEIDTYSCRTCGGYGFILPKKFVEEVKKRLKI